MPLPMHIAVIAVPKHDDDSLTYSLWDDFKYSDVGVDFYFSSQNATLHRHLCMSAKMQRLKCRDLNAKLFNPTVKTT
jgi:hypothetical protein